MSRGLLTAKVTITTVGPLSITMPVAEYTQPNRWNNFPVMTRGLDEDGQPKRTGYLPATTVRGALRRGAVVPAMEAAAAAGQPYTLHRTYADLIGQDAQSELQPDEIDLIAVQKLRDESAVVDLFGSGLGVKSRLRVSHFLPDVNVLPEVFTGVRKDIGDSEGVLDQLSDEDRDTYLSRERANRKRAQASRLVEDLKKAKRRGKDVPDDIDQQLEAAEALLAKYQDDMGDMRVSTRTLVQHYALPAGIDLHGRLIVERYKDRDLEMILAGLDAISQWPVLGAHSARGCGEISGTADVSVGGEVIKTVRIGDYEPAKIVDY